MSSPFSLDESVYQGLVYLTLAGEIDLSVADTIDAMIIRHLTTDATVGVVVDLAAVTFLDSTGISALLKGRRLADQVGALFHVIKAHGPVLRVLELAGVRAHLDPDVQGAAGGRVPGMP